MPAPLRNRSVAGGCDGDNSAHSHLAADELVAKGVEFLRNCMRQDYETLIVLGTGSAGIVRRLQDASNLSYDEIPGFVPTSAEGHPGQLWSGYLGTQPVLVMQGRVHLYEGFNVAQVVRPLTICARLGLKTAILTNAVGGLQPLHRVGELVALESQIDLTFHSPVGQAGEVDVLVPRNEGRRDLYSARLRERATEVARMHGIPLNQGVYAGVLGPNYETRAEYRLLRRLGADVVGMSTVHESIAAHALGMEVLGLSVITNCGHADDLTETSSHDVTENAAAAEDRLFAILHDILDSELT